MGIPLSKSDAVRLFRQFDASGRGVLQCRVFLNAVLGKVRCRITTRVVSVCLHAGLMVVLPMLGRVDCGWGQDFMEGWEIGAEAIPAKTFDPNPPSDSVALTRECVN